MYQREAGLYYLLKDTKHKISIFINIFTYKKGNNMCF